MGYTGRLGTGKARLGNILLGVLDTLGEGTFDYQVHQIEPDKIRVKFSTRIDLNTATQLSKYSLSIVTPFNAFSITPNIRFVSVYDSSETSVVLHLDNNLSTGSVYSITLGEIFDIFGDSVSFISKNFTANAILQPIALGAYLSKASHLDIVFNRKVGPNSASATFIIQVDDSTQHNVSQVTWSSAGIPENTLRLDLNSLDGWPTGDSYVVLFNGVIDESGNTGSGFTNITLVLRSPTPYDSIDIAQIQLTDAYVMDISNDLIDTASVRVYFSGPVIGGSNTANWNVEAIAPHKNTDVLNQVVSPNAVDLLTIVPLINEIKLRFNRHIIESQVHFRNDSPLSVTSPDAISLPTALTLTAELQEKVLAHFSSPHVHAYGDDFNGFLSAPVSDISSAVLIANRVKKAYNSHILPSYPISFSNQYPAIIGSITSHSSILSNEAYPVVSPYTYYVDLHLQMKSVYARLLITATLQSEDNLTVTNPLDYTGSITARSLNEPSIFRSYTPLTDRGVDLYFDKNISVSRNTNLVIKNNSGFDISAELTITGSEQAVVWAYNNLVFAYSKHIDSLNGAVHTVNDTINSITNSDYVTSVSLSEIILKANNLKSKVNLHISSSSFHFNPDTDLIRAQPASDLGTLVRLIDDMRETFLRHNARDGVHDGPGARIISAKLYDTLEIRTNLIQNRVSHPISGKIRSYYHNNMTGTLVYSNVPVDSDFLAVSNPPSLASVLPKIGTVKVEDGVSFESDSIEFYFTKPMTEVNLDSEVISVTGGSIILKRGTWLNEQVGSVEVMRMEETTYEATAFNMVDFSGVPIA